MGGEYAHAEARKCPTLDGVVLRDASGKEVRYPVNLTPEEKEIARKVQKAFKQNVCGFDLLRSQGKSYVCDVNGFSLVKSSKRYYMDCANQLRRIIRHRLNRSCTDLTLLYKNPVNQEMKNHMDNQKLQFRPERLSKIQFNQWELRSVVGVFRHGDRTPKQKMKMKTRDQIFLKFFEGKSQKKEVKLKTPTQLQKLLDITKKLLNNQIYNRKNVDKQVNLEKEKERIAKLIQLRNVLEMNKFEGLNRKVQMKPIKWEKDKTTGKEIVSEVVFILKWGGELTHAGMSQA